MRIAAKCEIEVEQHTSSIVFGSPAGGDADGIPNLDYGVPAVEVLDADFDVEPADDELERLRILARTPRWGREIDDGILPAEAGLDERAVSFTKGCFPGPGADRETAQSRSRQSRAARDRVRRRRRPARTTRSASRTESSAGSRAPFTVSRSPTSAPRSRTARTWKSRVARPGYTDRPAPVAQGIERCPAEAEVASSNLAGRIARANPPLASLGV